MAIKNVLLESEPFGQDSIQFMITLGLGTFDTTTGSGLVLQSNARD